MIEAGVFTANEELLCRNIAEHLNKKYPGHLWAVAPNDGLVVVYNLALSGRWGFVLHKDKIDPDYKAVTRAGGELLERFKLSRGKLNIGEFDQLKRDHITGQAIFDAG